MSEAAAAWAARVSAWRASGESARDYAARIGFAAATLRWWSSELGRRGVAVAEAPPKLTLARVELKSSHAGRVGGSGVHLSVGGLRVDVDRGFDAATLRAVLAAIAEAS
jgi:hypothetical protein